MPCSACCSAIVSGVAMVLLHLQLDETALDADGESVDWNVGGKIQRLPGVQIEPGAVPRALDPAALLVQLTVGQRPVVVRAAVLDRDDLAAAVEDPDLEVLPFHQATCAGRQLFERADVDDVGQIRSLHSALYPPLGGRSQRGRGPGASRSVPRWRGTPSRWGRSSAEAGHQMVEIRPPPPDSPPVS